MVYDFDTIVREKNFFMAKYDELGNKFGREDLIPLWIADMDFKIAEPIKEALHQRMEQGIFGYTSRPDSYFQAVSEWLERRHNWKVSPRLMSHSPGVVTSLNFIIETFSDKGDKIIIQPPVYNPFFNVVNCTGRKLIENPLIVVNGRYQMDFEHLEKILQNNAKILLLCSPHNPVGRVWEKEELTRLAEICTKYKILVVTDEIHSDLVFANSKHIPYSMVSSENSKNTITCISPSKTFNLAGLQTSIVIFSNESDKVRFDKIIAQFGMHRNNCFNLVATEAAYRYGEEWLEQVKKYIDGNFRFIKEFCQEHIPTIRPNYPEGTYLVWIDCQGLGMNRDELHHFMINEAKIAIEEGFWFSNDFANYIRMNAACPRSLIKNALSQLETAIKAKLQESKEL